MVEEYITKYMDDTAKIYEKYGIYEKLSAHINYLDGYGEYIESIKDKADEMLTFSIFFKKRQLLL